MSDDRFRTVKAILKNALLWGIVTGLVSGTLIGAYVFFVPGGPDHSFLARVQEAVFAGGVMGVKFAIAGAAVGTFFAVALRFAFRGGRIATLSIPRSALLGAIVGGAGIPLFYQFLNIISSGHTIAWNLVTDDAIWAAPFGAIAAATTVYVARRATALPAEREAEQLGVPDPLDKAPVVQERVEARRS